MPLRAELFEAAIEAPDSPPVILGSMNWVGHGGRINWCWAACAVMVELFNEKAVPGTESEVLGRLCKTANKILGTAQKKCCETDSCDELVTIDQINQLWEKNLNHPPRHKSAPFPTLVDELVHELQSKGLPIEADIREGGRIGHVVVIYGFGQTGTNKFFHVRDPAIDPSNIDGPHRTIPASALTDLCKNVWFDLEVRPKEN